MHRGHKLALLHSDLIVVEVHVSVSSSMDLDIGAESNDVVAAGDGGEDARLDVHRTIATCVNIVSINLNKQTSWAVGVVELHTDSVVVHD